MGMLDDLLGSGKRQQDYTDFVRRYDQGHPSEGYSDQEVMFSIAQDRPAVVLLDENRRPVFRAP